MKTRLQKFRRIFTYTLLFFFVTNSISKAQTGETLNFDGSDDYVQSSSITFGNNWTAEAWIKPTNLFGNWNVVLGQSYYGVNQGFVIAVQNGSVFLDSPGGSGYLTTSVSSGVWTHVAATYNNGIFAFYKNGQLVGVQTGTFANSSNQFLIGARDNNTNSGIMDYYQGNIDEVRIWNTTRTQCEIQQYMNAEIPGIATGLVRSYHFNEGLSNSALNLIFSYNTLNDVSGYGNDGSLQNFGLVSSGFSNWTDPGCPAQGNSSLASASLSEIDVQGNGNSIADGSSVPSATNHTDFNGVFTRTFVIYNTGSQTLNLATPVLTGTAASQFSITTVPATTLAASTGSTSFVVTFLPSSAGVKTTTLTIYNLDCSEPMYDFVITATALPGAALSLEGATDYATVSGFSIGTSDCTIETWFKQTSSNGGYVITTRSSEGGPAGGWWAFSVGSGTAVGTVYWELAASTGTYNVLQSQPGLFGLNTWNHMAVVRSGSQLFLYVNGVLQGTMTEPVTRNFNTSILRLGGWVNFSAAWFTGVLDETRVWNVAKTQSEIQSYMNCEIPTTATGLMANYHFNQGIAAGSNGTVTTVTDATGNYNMTLVNAALTGTSSNWVSPGGVNSGSVTVNTPTVEIEVRGNGNLIADGTTTVSTTDFTDFNGAYTRTFVVNNTVAGGTLNLAPYVSGTNASQFSVSTFPAQSIAGIGSASFVVSFTPTSYGTKTAVVNVVNNDANEALYDFVVSATPSLAAALNFDGINDYIETGASPVDLGQSDFTIETWIKTTGNDMGIMSCLNNNGTWETGEKSFIIENDGHVEFVGFGNDFIHASGAVNDGSWHHVALTWDLQSGVNGVGKIYIDGVDRTASSTYTANNTNIGTFKIGMHNGNESNVTFQGSMDEFRVWNVARTQCEIQTYMNCEITNTLTNLVANYHFNQGSPFLDNTTVGTLADAAAVPNTGTLSAFTLTGTTSNWISPGGVISGSVTPAVISASVVVKGNGNNVPIGAATSTANFTDFSTNTSRTFSLSNGGGGTLNISNIYFTGTNAAQFSVTTAASTAITTGTTGFVVTLTPTNTGISTATVNILTNDCSSPTFSFVITASTTPAEALNLDNNNDYVDLGTGLTSLFDPLNVITLEAWVYPTSTVGLGSIVGNWQSPVSVMQFLLQRAGDHYALHIDGGPGYLTVPSAANTVTLNTWQHVAGVWDGSQMRLYINGILQGVLANTGSSFPTRTNSVMIGGNNVNEQFTGSIDEVRVWTTARTQCQLQSFMNTEIATTATSLVANYHFNQGVPFGPNSSNTLVTDATGTYNGTLTNMSLLTGSVSNWVSPGGVTAGSTLAANITASILVSGNSNSISPGSVVTSTTNFTDFGTASTRTFVVQNANTGTLNIFTPYFTGTNASDFSVTVVPSSSLGASATTSFVVAFTPTATGVKNAMMVIPSNDCGVPDFSCALTATPPTADAIDLNGGLNYLAVSGHTLNNQSFTIEFYARRDSKTTGDFIFGQGTNVTNDGLHIGFYDQGVGDILTFDFYNSGLQVIHSDLNWHHWACVYDNSVPSGSKNRFIYRDGILMAADSYTSAYTGTGLSYIGTTPWGVFTDIFSGRLDELRIWSTARSQCEIQTYMNCEIPGTAPGLISNYHFNQGSPGLNNSSVGVAFDAASGYNATLNNFGLSGNTSNWVSPAVVAAGYTTATAPSGTLTFSGNGNNIPVGITTSTTNFTDFGSANTRTFVLQNPGAGPIYINTGYISGANASNFSVATTPASVIAGGGTSSLVISFTPSALGSHSAILNVVSSDCAHPTYSFVVSASVVPASALNFDGSDDVLTVSDYSIGTNDFTMESWIKPKGFSSPDMYILSNRLNNFGGTGNWFNVAISSNKLQIELGQAAATSNTVFQGTTNLATNNWYHVAVTRSGLTYKLYVNGVLETTANDQIVRDLTGNYSNAHIGGWPENGTGRWFNGDMDELRVWNVARSQCEIQDQMLCEITSTASGLLSNFHFNQGVPAGANSTITVLSDATGLHNGSFSNFALNGLSSNFVNPGAVSSGSVCPAFTYPKALVQGNSISIVSGTTVANPTDFTQFNNAFLGSTSTRTFVISNTGAASLTISNFSLSGSGASDFSITGVPASSVSPSGSTSIVITFSPATIGTKTAVVHIGSNDCGIPDYNFVIESKGLQQAAALDFDGSDDYVDLGNSSAFKPTSAITAEVWVNSAWPSSDQTILGNTENAGYGIFLRTTGVLEGLVRRNSAWGTTGTSLSGLSAGWHHVALSFDGRFTKLYVDGVLKSTDDAINTYTIDYNPFNNTLIGGEASSGSAPVAGWYFQGKIDEVRIWNVARTECELLTYMNTEIPSTASGLLANYHFNEGLTASNNLAFNTLPDFAGSSNTGTLQLFGLTGTSSNWVFPGAVNSGANAPSAPTASLIITGNTATINAGSVSTSTNNFTDFGASSSRTYVLNSTGAGNLYVTPIIYFTGSGAADFSLTTSPSSSIAASGSSSFAVSFIPSSLGTKTAVVHVVSSDCASPDYSFVITANPQSAAALRFNGLGGRAQVAVFNSNSTDVTMQAKVFFSASTVTNQVIAYNGNTSTNGFGLLVGTGSSSVFLLYGGNVILDLNYTLTAGQWTYLTAVIESTKISFYANGALTTTLDPLSVGGYNTPSGLFSVGANHLGTEVFNGSIDEVLLWSRPLTQCEVQAYATCEITGTVSGLDANYHFNQGIASGVNTTVTSVTDGSGNGHDLNIIGMTLSGANSNWVSPGAVVSGSACGTYSAPEIAVLGGTVSLVSGDASPSIGKNTDYNDISIAGGIVRTFTIQNTGNGSLSVSSITMSGADASSFLVGALLPASPIAAGNSAIFNVTFAPSSAGTKTAVVNISNSDCDEALFTYQLTGSCSAAQSFVFDGNDDYVNCGNILTASYTKEAWVKIDLSTNGNNMISAGSGVLGSAFWAPGIYSYKLSAGHDGAWNQVQDPTALSANTWYHVAVTYDAPSTTMNLYKNGVLVATNTTVQPFTGTSPLQLGAFNGTFVLNGSMDEVRIWNRALCPAEITNNMNCEIQTTASGLVANYHFNQGIGYGANSTQTLLTDVSGSVNTGTVMNSALSGTISNWQFTTAVTSGSFCPVITVPEINLMSNGVSIADGKTVSATSDNTDFGGVCINGSVVKTFTIQNTGAGSLSVSTIGFAGSGATMFQAGSLSPASPVPGGSSAVFTVTFTPTSTGVITTTLIISNSDCNESTYDVLITGTCNALPVVTATSSSSSVCFGSTVTLNGGGADTYTWTGGSPTVTDGVAFSPTVTQNYTVAGTNLLTGCTSTNLAVQGITVNPNPTITATASSSVICAGASSTIFPANASTYTLSPASQSPFSLVVSPSVTTTYSLSGTSANGCLSQNVIPITITVNPLPTVTANATGSAVCNGFTTSLYGSGADTYTWTGGVTNSVSFVPASSQDYTVTGTYTLTGCTSTNLATQSVVVNAIPVVSVSAVNSVICNGSQATLSALGANSYTWLPGPLFGSSVTVSPSLLTSYSVTGTSSANCTSTNLASQTISVNPLPTVTANISSSLVCEGTTVVVNGAGADTYTWTGGVLDASAFTASISSTFSVSGTNTVSGCTSTNNAVVTLTVNSLPNLTVNISDASICVGSTVTLMSSGASSYSWSGGVFENTPFTPTATADYTVTGTDANNCANSAVVTVSVNNLPILSVAPSVSMNCEAQTNTLTASGASSYTWNTGGLNDTLVVTPLFNTSYTVNGTDANGCSNQQVYTLSVTPCSDTVLVTASVRDESCKGRGDGSIALSYTTAQQNYQVSYVWNLPASCPANDCDSLGNLKPGVYDVKVRITYTLNSVLVRTDSVTKQVTVREGNADCELKVYSGITSNNDGVNDVMYIQNIEQFPNNKVMVFTRWGEEIFSMEGYNNLDKVWPMQEDLPNLSSTTYFYVIDPGNGGKVLKGWVELIKK